MGTFEGFALVNYPRELVFETNRDAMASVIRFVDDIERVVEEKRFVRNDRVTEITNTWYGKVPIPTFLEAVVKPHHLVWTDHAVWTSDDFTCRWRVVSNHFPHHVRCMGTTRYQTTTSVDRSTVSLEGKIIVDPSGAPALPAVAARQIATWIEDFVGALFPMALRKVTDGVSRTIEERVAAPRR